MPDRSKTARTRPSVDAVHRNAQVEQPGQGDRADRTDRAKMISVRLTTDEFEALSAQASELGIGPSTLARTLIRRGLADQSPATPSALASPTAHTPPAPPSTLESHLEAYLQAALKPDLVARVEALERWVAEH